MIDLVQLYITSISYQMHSILDHANPSASNATNKIVYFPLSHQFPTS